MRMLIREMRVALDHLERLVPEDLGDLRQRRTAHSQVRGRGVAQVVESEVLDLGLLHSRAPVRGWEGRLARLVGEDQIRLEIYIAPCAALAAGPGLAD